MPNQQLVDYIKQQMGLGVAKDAIKNVLLTSGWPEAEVADALSALQQNVAPATPGTSPAGAAKPATITQDIFERKGAEPVFQPKKDFAAPPKEKEMAEHAKPVVIAPAGRSSSRVLLLVLLVLVIAGGAAAIFFFMKNSGSDAKITALTDQNAALTVQVVALEKDKKDASTNLARLEADNADLGGELSFFALSGTSTEPASVSVKGMLAGGGKMLYTVTTAHGVTVGIKNSGDAEVDEALKTLVGSEVRISGTRVPGAKSVTVTAVNGQPL